MTLTRILVSLSVISVFLSRCDELRSESIFNIREPASITNAREDTTNKDIEGSAILLFTRASKRFEEKQYWKSTVDLIVIVDYYPGFSKIQNSIYLLGNCLYEMQMYHAADQIYRYLLKEFPQTPLFPKVILALQRVHYQKRDYQQSLKFYNALESHYPRHKAIDESRYYATQSHYHLKNYNIVPTITRHIKRNSEFYPFGLYTEALVHLKKKNIRQALENLVSVTEQSAKSQEQKEIVDAARLTLGYIYFELSNYKKAIEKLVDIAPTFYDYPEVLLALGWCAYKLGDYRVAIDALSSLVSDYPEIGIAEEAHFVQGQSYLKLGYYNLAINEFSEITSKSAKTVDYSSYGDEAMIDIAEQERMVENLKTELLFLESKLLQSVATLSDKGGPDFVSKERERMRQLEEELIERILRERKVFEAFSAELASLRTRIEKAERQKKWLSYAEYGRARALYLKGIEEK